MIIRPQGASGLLITQPDHAALSALIMRAWREPALQHSVRRAEILLAVEEHDNGWKEIDGAPLLDAATGRVLDFTSAPADVRQSVWPRAVARLSTAPYAAALVAQHAIHVYGRFRTAEPWQPFFETMHALRERHLRAAAPATLDRRGAS